MTIEHAGPFLESALFSGARANVMMVLCNYADDYGESWPSYEAIACAARCARETAMREVAWLAEHECLEILRGDDRPADKRKIARRSNVYRVNLRLVETLYSVMREIKLSAGREPGKRYDAVRFVAGWAEKTIVKSGADVLITAMRKLIAEGDVTSLLQKDNSDERSPSDNSKGDIDADEGDVTSPKPSEEPPSEPSGEKSPDDQGCRDDGSGENLEARERREAAQLKVLMRWLRERCVERLEARAIEHLRFDLSGEEADALALAINGAMRRKAESWVSWAHQIIEKTDNGAKPTDGVLRLVEAMEHPVIGVMVEARCAQMVADSEAKAAEVAARCRDGPGGDDQQAD